jgi:hypothetical protein
MVDDLARNNAFNAVWKIDGFEVHPGKRFAENKLLMDLTAQPDGIRELIVETLDAERERTKTYSHFSFLRFTGKHKLRRIAEDAEQFTRMFSTSP